MIAITTRSSIKVKNTKRFDLNLNLNFNSFISVFIFLSDDVVLKLGRVPVLHIIISHMR